MGKTKRAADKSTRAVIYLRVSTDKQAATGHGLDAQEKACRDACERLGLTVGGVYSDPGISGRDEIESRPGLQAAIADIEEHPGTTLVVYELSRLARSQRIIWTLLDGSGDYAIPLVSASQAFETVTPLGRAMLGMLGVWAQLESDMIGERTRDAMAAAMSKGKKMGRPSMIESVDKKTGLRFVDPKKVEVIRTIQALYATGVYSHEALAKKLQHDGVKGSDGGEWRQNTIYRALRIQLPAAAPAPARRPSVAPPAGR